jgi:glycosyltransferase involved in cell wall biosynthesis
VEVSVDFTVLMPVYYKISPALFNNAIESIYNNTTLPTFLILVVDGPVFGALYENIQRLQNKYKFEVLWIPLNVGIAVALNRGLDLVRTTWVARADADDFNMPERFELQLSLVNKGFDLIGSAIKEVEESGDFVGVRAPPCIQKDIENFSRYRNPFNHMTVFFRTSLAIECGGYPNIYLKEDYALWVLMIKRGARTANSPETLVSATAGRNMYKRRGGWLYVKSEVDLQLHLVLCGLKNKRTAIFHGVLRSLVFLLPSNVRGLIYKFFLRQI